MSDMSSVSSLGYMKILEEDGSFEEQYKDAIPQTTKSILQSGNATTCGVPRDDAFHIFRHPTDSDTPWPGMLLGIFFLASWYWCTDQVSQVFFNG